MTRLWRGAVFSLVGTLAPRDAAAAPTEPNSLANPLVETVACENCHLFVNAVVQVADPPYSPFRTAQGTMMANSARDPVFWAGVAVADADAPGQTELCIRCHAPRAFLDGHGDVTSIDELTDEERSGVECEVCHRAMEDLDTPAGNAQYQIDDVVVGTNVPRRGPFDFTDGVDPPPHSWIHDPYTGSSRLCGTCHDVSTPAERVDDAGVGLGVAFNEQRTYSEWLGSAFAEAGAGFRSCQDCHMPAVEDMPACTEHVNLQSHPTGGRRHDLVGANRFMIGILKAEYGSAGSNRVADVFYDVTEARYDEFLATSATLEVATPTEVDLTEGLESITVRVTNNTGHKLPTGYSEGRVMWIEVLAEYAGQRIYSSGAWDQAAGFETDAQLHTYEAIGDDWSDGTQFHLLRNNHWVIDSRIPPLGLRPNIETDPVGDRYTLQPDETWPNFDETSYTFAAAPNVADVTPDDPDEDRLVVTVRLRYLINTPEYISFLAGAGGDAGQHVAELFEVAGGAVPETLAEHVVEIPIVGFGAVAGTDSGSSGASSGSSGVDDTGSASGTDSGAPSGSSTTVTATGEGTTALDTSGSAGAETEGGGGCGCRTRGSSVVPLVFLPLLLRRRRRD